MKFRGSGLLLHITSLPSRFGIGDLGPAAFEFVRFLYDSGQRYWQILPLHPTDQAYDNSPYHALSAFALNPLLISPEKMVESGFLGEGDIYHEYDFSERKADYPVVIEYKENLLSVASCRFIERGFDAGFSAFCLKNKGWLEDYALYIYLRKSMGNLHRTDWPANLIKRDPEVIERIKRENSIEILKEKVIQYIISLQWQDLKEECKKRGITIIGDIPIYVDYDSADVWMHPEFFKLDEKLKPFKVSGVPPDYFSQTGQVWNNPVYNWEELKRTCYSWWIARVEHILGHVDYLRLDHFRGLVAFWEISAGSDTAIGGVWKEAPAKDFIRCLASRVPCLPIIAEDLGYITPDVREVIREFSIPGMRVLLFGFGSGMPGNPNILHNIPKNCVLYTGTHDNNTVLGWYTTDASYDEKVNLANYLGREPETKSIALEFIRMAMMSAADTVIIPVQDLLGLGGEARMNKPGTDTANWTFRLATGQLTHEKAVELRRLTEIYGRI